jgi:hypothetical protein
MPSEPISGLTNGNPAQAGDLLPIARSGANFSVTAASLAALALGVVASGSNIVPLAPPTDSSGNFAFPAGALNSPINLGGATNTMAQYVPGNSLLCSPSSWKITLYSAGATTATVRIVKCNPGTGVVVGSANVTFNGGSTTAVFASQQFLTSDAIAFALTPGFDYYFLLNSSSSLFQIFDTGSGQSGQAGGCYVFASNQLNPSTLVFTGGTLEAGKNFTAAFQGA